MEDKSVSAKNTGCNSFNVMVVSDGDVGFKSTFTSLKPKTFRLSTLERFCLSTEGKPSKFFEMKFNSDLELQLNIEQKEFLWQRYCMKWKYADPRDMERVNNLLFEAASDYEEWRKLETAMQGIQASAQNTKTNASNAMVAPDGNGVLKSAFCGFDIRLRGLDLNEAAYKLAQKKLKEEGIDLSFSYGNPSEFFKMKVDDYGEAQPNIEQKKFVNLHYPE